MYQHTSIIILMPETLVRRVGDIPAYHHMSFCNTCLYRFQLIVLMMVNIAYCHTSLLSIILNIIRSKGHSVWDWCAPICM